MNDKNLKPFEKGDKRINRNGRPKNFDAMRELTRVMGAEIDIRENEAALTYLETILDDWRKSKNYQKQKAFIEYAFGKVPEKMEMINDKSEIMIKWTNDKENEDNN